MNFSHFRNTLAGITALVAGMLSQFADAAIFQMGDAVTGRQIEFNTSNNRVEVPIYIENNDAGTEYIQFDTYAIKAMIEGIYNFGNNSSVGTLADFVNSGSITIGFSNANSTYVQDGYTLGFNPDGSSTMDEDDAVPVFLRETWQDSVNHSIDTSTFHTISIDAAKLDANGVAADYFMNPLGTPSDIGDLNLFQSTNTYQTDHGSPAGVAETSGGSFPTADNTYVQTAVIPEPGTLVLFGLGGLIPLSVHLSRTVRRRGFPPRFDG